MTTPLSRCPVCGHLCVTGSKQDVDGHGCPALPATPSMVAHWTATAALLAIWTPTLERNAQNPTAEQCGGVAASSPNETSRT